MLGNLFSKFVDINRMRKYGYFPLLSIRIEVYEKHLHISITRYFDIKPSVLKDFKLLELKVTSLTGIHTLTIYRNQERQIRTCSTFFKRGTRK